jgi:hypothetical protein
MPSLYEFDEYVIYSWRREQIKEQIKKNKHIKRIRDRVKKNKLKKL